MRATFVLIAVLSGCQSEVDSHCELLRQVCERQVACGVVIVSQETSVNACAAECVSAEALFAGTALDVDLEAIRACSDAIAAASCETLANERMAGLAACETLYRGTLSEGESCLPSPMGDPCGDGLACAVAEIGGCGVCVGEQDACVEASCPAGMYCNEFGGCMRRRAIGEVCEGHSISSNLLWEQSCEEDAYCGWRDASSLGPRRCWPRASAGQACRYPLTPFACEPGQACVLGTCEPERQLGEECHDYSECSPGLTCAGTCIERRDEGESCGAWFGECRHGLACLSGRCQPAELDPGRTPPRRRVLEPGARCDAGDGICPLGTACRCADRDSCRVMTCAPGPRLGESCAPVTISGENGSIVKEDPFDLYACSEGYCDFLASRTCVAPADAGGPCSYVEPTSTMECASLVCENRTCLGLVLECRPAAERTAASPPR